MKDVSVRTVRICEQTENSGKKVELLFSEVSVGKGRKAARLICYGDPRVLKAVLFLEVENSGAKKEEDRWFVYDATVRILPKAL